MYSSRASVRCFTSPSFSHDPGYITRLKQCMSALHATSAHTSRIRNTFIDNSLIHFTCFYQVGLC